MVQASNKTVEHLSDVKFLLLNFLDLEQALLRDPLTVPLRKRATNFRPSVHVSIHHRFHPKSDAPTPPKHGGSELIPGCFECFKH